MFAYNKRKKKIEDAFFPSPTIVKKKSKQKKEEDRKISVPLN